MLVSTADLLGIMLLMVSTLAVLVMSFRRVYVLEEQVRHYRKALRELRS